jgi:HAD superfamily hydrolase (TIGR01490 family)
MFNVIFDLDGTLTKRDTYIPFLAHCLRAFGLRKLSLLFLPYYALLYKSHIISNHQLKEFFLKAVLARISLEDLTPVSEEFVLSLIETGMNEPIVQLLQDHLTRRHNVILATASFDLYVMILAEQLGIRHVVCTGAEVKDGFITGRILGNNCHGLEKVKRIDDYCGQTGVNCEFCYTDHYSAFEQRRLTSHYEKGGNPHPQLWQQ